MRQSRRLAIVLGLNLALVAGLWVAGLAIGSVSVLAAAADCVADAFALGLGLLAVHLRDRHGRAGATTAVAVLNGLTLLVVAVSVLAEAVVRIAAGAPAVAAPGVLAAGVVTALVLAVGAVVLGAGAGHEDLHMRSVLLDTVFDGLAAAGVALAGLVMALAHGLYWIDPALAAVIALAVGVGAVRLLVDAATAHRAASVRADADRGA